MSFFVRFWGVRGSIPTPGHRTSRYGGNTPCVEIRVNGTRFICDGGTGIRGLGTQLMQESRGAPISLHMLFSHAHWDHIQGFPFFGPAYVPTTRITVYGARDGDTRMYRLLNGQQLSDYFPVQFSDLGAHIEPGHLGDGHRVIEGVAVSAIPVAHPGGCYAFRFEWEGKRVVYATDHELDQVLTNLSRSRLDPGVLRRPPPDLVEFCRGADLLICDGQYTEAEYPKHIGWGHSRATSAVDLAVLADVKRLAIFHHDPMQSDDDVDRKIEHCRDRVLRMQGGTQVFAAREGIELKMGK
jgi:phosphoribosyl 1,2-cyclic phosphodiesterase